MAIPTDNLTLHNQLHAMKLIDLELEATSRKYKIVVKTDKETNWVVTLKHPEGHSFEGTATWQTSTPYYDALIGAVVRMRHFEDRRGESTRS